MTGRFRLGDLSSPLRRWWRTIRRRVQALPFTALLVVWVMLQGEITWANVIAGALVAFGVLMLFPLPPLSLGVRVHPWAMVVLIVKFNWDLIVASFQIAARALQPGWQPEGRILRVPLRSDHDLIAVINAEMNALVPGSVVIDVNPDERWMLLHVFHVPNDRALHRALQTARSQEVRVIRALSIQRDLLLADLREESGGAHRVAARQSARDAERVGDER